MEVCITTHTISPSPVLLDIFYMELMKYNVSLMEHGVGECPHVLVINHKLIHCSLLSIRYTYTSVPIRGQHFFKAVYEAYLLGWQMNIRLKDII